MCNYGKTPEKKEYHLVHIFQKDASREDSQGSMIVSCEILIFAKSCSSMIEMKMFVSNGTILQNKISPIECQNQIFFITGKIGGSLSTSPETQPSVVHTKPFTPRIWRTTTQAHAILEVSATATVIEFFLYLVAMEWILVVFLTIQRKSMKGDACKGL